MGVGAGCVCVWVGVGEGGVGVKNKACVGGEGVREMKPMHVCGGAGARC